MRLIDADALRMLWLDEDPNLEFEINTVLESIDEQPTVEAEPVRHGRWDEEDERSAYKGFLVSCSECGAFLDEKKKEHFAYCYHCGAKMDGGVSDD